MTVVPSEEPHSRLLSSKLAVAGKTVAADLVEISWDFQSTWHRSELGILAPERAVNIFLLKLSSFSKNLLLSRSRSLLFAMENITIMKKKNRNKLSTAKERKTRMRDFLLFFLISFYFFWMLFFLSHSHNLCCYFKEGRGHNQVLTIIFYEIDFYWICLQTNYE